MTDTPFIPNPALVRRVREAAYLTADNAHRYRPILRHFYEMHTAHRYWLAAGDVLTHVRAHFDPDYSDEQCEQDLRMLVDWGNLIAEQEKSRARTVEEFLRRRLRYQLTPYSIAFERLLQELEAARGTHGSLDASLLDSLWSHLDALRHILAQPIPSEPGYEYLKQVHHHWGEGYRYFERIVADANDYLAAMHRARPEDLHQLEVFLAYKDVLLRYLSAFINQLMDCAEKVRGMGRAMAAANTGPVLVGLLSLYATQYLPDPNGVLPESATVRARYQGELQALTDWFRRGGGVEMLRRVTADAIETVVRQTQRLMDRRRLGISRRRDLERLAGAFAACRSVEDAHRLAALALGCAAPRHVLGSEATFSMSDADSVWRQPADAVPLRPIQRGGRRPAPPPPGGAPRGGRPPVLGGGLARRPPAAGGGGGRLPHGDIRLGALHVPDPAVRSRLLTTLAACLASPEGTAVASDGSRIQLIPPRAGTTYGEMTGPDGVLVTPRFGLRRRQEGPA